MPSLAGAGVDYELAASMPQLRMCSGATQLQRNTALKTERNDSQSMPGLEHIRGDKQYSCRTPDNRTAPTASGLVANMQPL